MKLSKAVIRNLTPIIVLKKMLKFEVLNDGG
jgi:hypothetical protein